MIQRGEWRSASMPASGIATAELTVLSPDQPGQPRSVQAEGGRAAATRKPEAAAEALDTLIASGAVGSQDAMNMLPQLMRFSSASGADATQLAQIGIRGVYEGALKYAGNPALISRAHFARYLVEIGVAKNVHDVFLHYLARGKPGYVEHVWATLEDAVGWIKGAGGLAVVAHPGRYRLSCAEMNMLFEQFRDLGGEAVEVSCGAHDGGQLLAFARMARKYGLLASRASDFHGPEDSPIDLGRASPLPPDLTPVWTRLA